MKKLLMGLSLVLLLFVAMGATAAAQASTLLSDNYEGAVKWNPNSTGWAISTAQVYGGTHSAHAPSSNNNLMIYGPFDLSAATAATLSFQLWYSAPKASFPLGTQATAGAFLVEYSTNGSSFTLPYQWSGSTSGEWWPTEFDLGSWSLLGQPQVWIALGTTTYAGALYSEGAYVDDLSLTATTPTPTPTPTPTVTPKVTLKLSGLKRGVLKIGKRVTAKGSATPASLAGSKVTLTVQKKKGTKWVKAKTAPATISSTSAYSWKYKPTKKGVYRVRTTMAKTAAHTAAKTAWRGFQVK